MSFPWLGSSWMPVHCRPPCWRTCLPERGTLHSLIRPKTTTTRPLSRSDAAVVAFRYWTLCGVADVRRGRASSARRWHTCNPLHAHFSVSRRLTSKSVLGGIGCGVHPLHKRLRRADLSAWVGSTINHICCHHRRQWPSLTRITRYVKCIAVSGRLATKGSNSQAFQGSDKQGHSSSDRVPWGWCVLSPSTRLAQRVVRWQEQLSPGPFADPVMISNDLQN